MSKATAQTETEYSYLVEQFYSAVSNENKELHNDRPVTLDKRDVETVVNANVYGSVQLEQALSTQGYLTTEQIKASVADFVVDGKPASDSIKQHAVQCLESAYKSLDITPPT